MPSQHPKTMRTSKGIQGNTGNIPLYSLTSKSFCGVPGTSTSTKYVENNPNHLSEALDALTTLANHANQIGNTGEYKGIQGNMVTAGD